MATGTTSKSMVAVGLTESEVRHPRRIHPRPHTGPLAPWRSCTPCCTALTARAMVPTRTSSAAGKVRRLTCTLTMCKGTPMPHRPAYACRLGTCHTCITLTMMGLSQVPASAAALPPALYSTPTRRRAVADFLTRAFGAAVANAGADARAHMGGWSGEKGGDMGVDAPGTTTGVSFPVTHDRARSVCAAALERGGVGDWRCGGALYSGAACTWPHRARPVGCTDPHPQPAQVPLQ